MRFLEQQLHLRQLAGKAITIVGLAASSMAMNGCRSSTTSGEVPYQHHRELTDSATVHNCTVKADSDASDRELMGITPQGKVEVDDTTETMTTEPEAQDIE